MTDPTREVPTTRARPGEAGTADAPASPSDVDGLVHGLILHRKSRPTGVVPLDPRRPYTLGRGTGADLFFDDEAVSRLHASLKHDGAHWVLQDARSANGTFVAKRANVALDQDEGRRTHFAEARLLEPGETHTLSRDDVVFLGDAHAAICPANTDELRAAEKSGAPGSSDAAAGGRSNDDGTFASPAGQAYGAALRKAARALGPVLLIGRSGSGKTWAARRIHDGSARAGRFVALNAAALPQDPTQLRSALLGHKRGAFTGADRDLEGAWFAADRGTLFLDEIDSLAETGQAFLLTLVEQSADLVPLGAAPTAKAAHVDVRVIAASKVPLADAGLREDLAFRLVDGTIVEIPSLAERTGDIPFLIQEILAELAREDGASAPFSDEALRMCQRAAWPGEIRQLRSVVRTLSRDALFEGMPVVSSSDVQERLTLMARALGRTAAYAVKPRLTSADSARSGEGSDDDEDGPARSVNPRHLSRDDILAALDAEDGNIQRTADRLGIARGTLVAKMDRFHIERPGRQT